MPKGVYIRKRVYTELEKHNRSISHIGKNTWSKGSKKTDETKKKLSMSGKGKKHIYTEASRKKWIDNLKKNHKGMFGKHHTEKSKIKIREAQCGPKCRWWKGELTAIDRDARNHTNYKIWRREVFYRDNFTCQKCHQYGGKLRAHHINNFSDFPELRTVLSNGIVLCCECHKKFHRIYGTRNNTKEQLEEFLKNN